MIELKLTTQRAVAYEEKTGRDILETLGDIASAAAAGRMPKLKQLVDIFCSMGEGYDIKKFDEWEATLQEKIIAVSEAAKIYIVGKNEKAISTNSSRSATISGSSRKK